MSSEKTNQMKRYQITIKGPNVQRCGFRKHASVMARSLQLSGLAEYLNMDVFMDVEGTSDNLNLFLQWCHIGPSDCMIEGVEIIELPVLGLTGFNVVPGVEFTKLIESA